MGDTSLRLAIVLVFDEISVAVWNPFVLWPFDVLTEATELPTILKKGTQIKHNVTYKYILNSIINHINKIYIYCLNISFAIFFSSRKPQKTTHTQTHTKPRHTFIANIKRNSGTSHKAQMIYGPIFSTTFHCLILYIYDSMNIARIIPTTILM